MIIVFANMNEKEFEIYTGSGKTRLPFSQSEMLRNITRNEQILYVTSASYVTVEQLMSLADSTDVLAGQNEPLYIHSTKPGCLLISEMNLSFNGPTDFKTIADIGIENIKRSPILSSLLKRGDLEIVSESRSKKIKDKYMNEIQIQKQKQNEEMQRRATSTEHGMGGGYTPMRVAGKEINYDDVIPIDVEKVSFSGSTPNESQLLPGDA